MFHVEWRDPKNWYWCIGCVFMLYGMYTMRRFNKRNP